MDTDTNTQTANNTASKLAPYTSSLEYYKDYLTLLSLQLHREVLLTRAMRGDDRQEAFLGLFISEQDISAILSELHGSMLKDFPQGELLLARITTKEQTIQERLKLTNAAPNVPALAWQRLQAIFDLSQDEINMLLMALAPEIYHRFAKVYAYLHDDVARKNLSGALLEKLTQSSDLSARLTRKALHSNSALIKYALLQLQDNNDTYLLNRGIKLPVRITHYLLDIVKIEDDLVDILQLPWHGQAELIPSAYASSIHSIADRWLQTPLPIMLMPAPNIDYDVWLAVFCEKTNVTCLSLDWQYLADLPLDKAQQLLVKFIREGHLSNSLLHLYNVDERARALTQTLFNLMTPLLCLSSTKNLQLGEFPVALMHAKLSQISHANRVTCWAYELKNFPELTNVQLDELVLSYPISMRSLRTICLGLPNYQNAEAFHEGLSRACRQQVSQKMADVAQAVSTPFTFDDLILPAANMHTLRNIIAAQKDKHKVMQDWGLADIFYQSNASAVLFVGPSGTGKTMAANVLANELGLDLFRVDLAGVVSKYIGETEKNLDKIFSVAAVSKVVLFIDEADALFGKRTEVKDAHDRYANIEVSYLLQKMEQHPGLVILASNLGQNIDEAFSRRFSNIVEFSLPKEQERLALWQKLAQSRAPLHDNIDLAFLAQGFEISGGHIRNCILQAAYQAAAKNEAISMQMLVRALSKEYAKMGRPISKNSFGDYYAVIRREASGTN
jgi:AAA+ superfamily predicted ATPase